MPIAKDAHSLRLRLLRAIPANRLGLGALRAASRMAFASLPSSLELRVVQIARPGGEGRIRAIVLRPKGMQARLPIVVHFHGGGYVMGGPEAALPRALLLQTASPCILVMPDYRLAPRAPFPAGHDDCYTTLLWAFHQALDLGGDPARIAIGGESAGGGLALATALRARDEGIVAPAFMFPICPMIDDREERWSKIDPSALSWSPALTRYCWDLLLGGQRGADSVSAYAAPARHADYTGLPPTLSYVGECDLLLAGTRSMVQKLQTSGTDVTYAEFPRAYHGLETLAPRAKIAGEINRFYANSFRQMVDRYC